jgi:uncharacterized protein
MNHPTGTFCFAELHTSDPEAARRFYGAVFGWSAVDAAGPSGAASLFQVDGQDVAGALRSDGSNRWVPYVSVDSVDRTTARALELRASLITAPLDMAGSARTSVIQDPAGGVVGFWEARGHNGAAMLDDPGSMWWAELVTRDVPSAKTFYSQLLRWHPVDTLKYGIRYSVFKLGDDPVAGLLPIGADWGPVSPYWQVLFAVDNCDAAVERARSAGGKLVFGPNDVPNAGRAAIVADPNRAVFTVMQPKSQGASRS